ncbi:undecaprenyl-diphosphatase UppP [Chloroflexota bacterium]
MTVLQSILLGVIQGLTEFLPISSSGHLVIVPYFLGWHIPATDAFIFDVLLQVATLVAVIVYFWKDLIAITKAMLLSLKNKSPMKTQQARLGWNLILATIPAGIIGLLLKETVENTFANPKLTAWALFLTAILLIIAERGGKRDRNLEQLDWKDVLWIGFSQVLAIFPGVSRSGATIAGGMTRDLGRPTAARFSFLMSIPIMLVAGLSATYDLIRSPYVFQLLPTFIPGFISAAVVGYLTIRWLLRFLVSHPLYIFAVYCSVMGLLVIVSSYL